MHPSKLENNWMAATELVNIWVYMDFYVLRAGELQGVITAKLTSGCA